MQHKAKYRAIQCVALGVSLLISIAYVWNLAAYGVPPLMLVGGGLAVLGLVHQTAATLIALLARERLACPDPKQARRETDR